MFWSSNVVVIGSFLGTNASLASGRWQGFWYQTWFAFYWVSLKQKLALGYHQYMSVTITPLWLSCCAGHCDSQVSQLGKTIDSFPPLAACILGLWALDSKKVFRLDPARNLSTWVAEAGGSGIQGQPWLHEILSQKWTGEKHKMNMRYIEATQFVLRCHRCLDVPKWFHSSS